MAMTSFKRSMFSNTSCFSNHYLFECLRKHKSKSYLNSHVMTMIKDLSLAKKKLDCLRMKMCKGVRLRRVKVKGLAHKRSWEKVPFPLICHLSTKCVSWWSLHSKWWTHVYGILTVVAQHTWLETNLSSRSSSLRKVAMLPLVMEASHRLKGNESYLYQDCQTLQMFFM